MTKQKKIAIGGILFSLVVLIGGVMWETMSFPTFFQEQAASDAGGRIVSLEAIEDPTLRKGIASMREGDENFREAIKKMGWDISDPSEVMHITLKAPSDGTWSDPYDLTEIKRKQWGNAKATFIAAERTSEFDLIENDRLIPFIGNGYLTLGPRPILKIKKNVVGSSEDIYWDIVILRRDKK